MKNKNEAVEELAFELYKNRFGGKLEVWNKRLIIGLISPQMKKCCKDATEIIDLGYSKSPTQCKSDDGKCKCGEIATKTWLSAKLCDKCFGGFMNEAHERQSPEPIKPDISKRGCGNGLEHISKYNLYVVLAPLFCWSSEEPHLYARAGLSLENLIDILHHKFGTPNPSTRSDMPVRPTEDDVIKFLDNYLHISYRDYVVPKDENGDSLRPFAKAILQLLKSKEF